MKSKILALLLLLLAPAVYAQDVCDRVRGAVLIAQDAKNTYLGKIASSFDTESIFNEFGTYGSPYNALSIWNEFGTFGSEFNTHSATNAITSTPPMIIKNRKIIGYVSANKNIRGSITPNLLKLLCKDEL